MKKQRICVVDIDGTIADVRPFLHHITRKMLCDICSAGDCANCVFCDSTDGWYDIGGKPDYEAFYRSLKDARPYRLRIALIRLYAWLKGAEIAFSTGRPHTTEAGYWLKQDTHRWVARYFGWYWSLRARARKDRRPSHLVKKEHLEELAKDCDIIAFIDDKEENCEMAREFGVPRVIKINN